MKHILPILTLALVGAATTAFAGTPYTEATFFADNYTEKFDKLLDTTSTAGDRNGSYNFGSYVVTFEGWSKLKIHANEKINLYVYDVVDNVGSGNNVSALKGSAPNPVQQIGYRELGTTDNATIHALGNPTDSEVLQRYYEGENPKSYEVVRNSYYLGEFEAGKDYELYVSYNADGSGGKWSYADWGGGYNAQTDAMMSFYLSHNNINAQASQYAALAQVNGKSFGLRTGPGPAVGGGTVGSPLPGGNAIYVIAGLFALGFIVARRRKEIAA